MSSIVQHAPKFNQQDATRFALDLYDLKASARQLPSERDQNFRLTDTGGKDYVLKLANSTERREVLDFQNQAMIHLAGKRQAVERLDILQPAGNRRHRTIQLIINPSVKDEGIVGAG